MSDDLLARCVREFHDAMGLRSAEPFPGDPSLPLAEAAHCLGQLAAGLSGDDPDLRTCRAHLMCEELGELLAAMAAGDEVTALDGYADLLYVVIGTGVAFDWPLLGAFAEAHASNMTKAPGQARPGHPGKPEGLFLRPDFARVLATHRELGPGSPSGATRTQRLRSRIERLLDDLGPGDRDALEGLASAMSWSRELNEEARAACQAIADKYQAELDDAQHNAGEQG